MRVLIIEDEVVAANRMREMLIAYDPAVEILDTLDSVIDAVNFLSKREIRIDIILMDIQLSDGLCFEIFEEIEIDCPILFTTAYDQYTLKAFKVNSIDYLLKPIEFKELSESIEKFKRFRFTHSHTPQNTDALLKTLKAASSSFKVRFLIKTPSGFIPISSNVIAYFYSEDKLTFLMTGEGKKHVVDVALEELITQLDPKQFFKISRNFIVHHNSIKEIYYHLNNRLKLQLLPSIDKDVFISRNNVKKFKEWMNS